MLALDEAELAAAFHAAFPRKLGNIRRILAKGSFALTRRHAQRYIKDGVVPVGDAAHTIHPLAGQGVNLGFQDAAKLAEVILEAAAHGRDFASADALQRYQRARKPAIWRCKPRWTRSATASPTISRRCGWRAAWACAWPTAPGR